MGLSPARQGWSRGQLLLPLRGKLLTEGDCWGRVAGDLRVGSGLGLRDWSRQDLGLFMIISFLLNFPGQTEGEQRNSSLQVSVSGLELLSHVVAEMRMYDTTGGCGARAGMCLSRGRAVVGLTPYLGCAEAARGLAPELTGNGLRALKVASRQS